MADEQLYDVEISIFYSLMKWRPENVPDIHVRAALD
jgi:hypothetical protein